MTRDKGARAIMYASWRQLTSRPIYYIGIFVLPLFVFIFLTDLMKEGLPTRVPAAIVDRDGTPLSRQMSQTIANLQMVDIEDTYNSFSEGRKAMQTGDIFGYFLIPENFEADLLAGRKPVVTYYTNMTYYVPGTLLFKGFTTAALYTKAGLAVELIETATGATADEIKPLVQPVSFVDRPLANPELNYAIYLCNSFVPGTLQLMILLITCFSIGQLMKYGKSAQLLWMADGSVCKAMFWWLLPQTIIWWIIALFMESLLFCWCGYPINGSWFWITLSELMYVLAAQGFALFIISLVPNLRMAVSVSALLGILTYSLGAYSFPIESMYGGISIFTWLLPARYNFLIYIDQALNGIDIYYSRIWFAVYIAFMLLPFTLIWRLKTEMKRQVYVP